ncbi:MAG: phosphodiesterase [Clostridiaceae bacterium]
MKIMIASDIHGSSYYCEKMIEAYKKEKVDKLLLLGDILYHGPRNGLPSGYDPKAVAEILNGIREDILCVRGNCDAEVDQLMLKFPIMADYCILYLNGRMIFATHGHHFNPAQPPNLKKGDILLNGHTHIPKFEKNIDFFYMNPGSVSLPKENSPHGYMVLDEGTFIWKDIEGTAYDRHEPD